MGMWSSWSHDIHPQSASGVGVGREVGEDADAQASFLQKFGSWLTFTVNPAISVKS